MASLELGIRAESTIWPVDDRNLMGDAAVRGPESERDHDEFHSAALGVFIAC
jgi:hypothetical protein